MARLLGQAVLEEKAVDRAVGDRVDLPGEPSIDGKQSSELGDGAGGPFLDEAEDGVGELFVVDPRGRLPYGRREECLRTALPEAGDVVADRPVRDAVSGAVLVTEPCALLQGQLFIGEGFDELEDGGAFLETRVRKALPVGFGSCI